MPTRRRQQRINELLREEIGMLLMREARDPRLTDLTVTGVEISPDLSYARVYISLIGNEEDKAAALEGLRHAAGFLKRGLAERIQLRRIPDLTFRFDESIERGQRILNILYRIGREQTETDGKHGEI